MRDGKNVEWMEKVSDEDYLGQSADPTARKIQ
jgi:hypothetical protein